MSKFQNVAVNFANVQEKIRKAESRAHRAPHSAELICVTKGKPLEAISAAMAAGAKDFGENYVQEALKKIETCDTKVHWHFIGALQTNKSKMVVGKFETIQSVDRLELAEALNKRALDMELQQKILIQIKLGDEPTKNGIVPGDVPSLLEKIQKLSALKIEGLMSLPPIEAEAEPSRKYFSQLFSLREKWKSEISPERGSFFHLSMGTTHDFEVAVEEGATQVRVGTAVFGPRFKA